MYGKGDRKLMGIYHMIINESKKEYLYFVKYNLNVKIFMNPTHGMILAWILQFSEWNGDNIKMINDSSDEDMFNEIRSNWKNREDDFIKGYLEYIEDLDGFDLFGVDARQSMENVKNE